ncbi:MAG TPA: chemotaxis protein CheW [Polyangiaceae bacterium]|nr:chemotaxis protein CheW [Polyangiaceae bacterium]
MTGPNSQANLEILRKRAKVLASSSEDEQSGALVGTVVVLELGDHRVGLSLSALDEIVPLTPIAALAGLPSWLPGIAQVRGRIVSVLDLHAWLKMTGHISPRYLVVVSCAVGTMGILVEAIGEVRIVHAKDLAESLTTDRTRGLLATTKDLTSILDIDVLLSHPDMLVDHGATRDSV